MGDDIVEDEDSHTNVHSVFDPRGTFIFSPTPNFSPTPLSLSLFSHSFISHIECSTKSNAKDVALQQR